MLLITIAIMRGFSFKYAKIQIYGFITLNVGNQSTIQYITVQLSRLYYNVEIRYTVKQTNIG